MNDAMDMSEIRRELSRSMDPDHFACKIRYQSTSGEVTDRFISPIRFVAGGSVVNAMCLGREECRNFIVGQIQLIRRLPASSVMMPAAITVVRKRPRRERRDKD